jgi:hypothetical protein
MPLDKVPPILVSAQSTNYNLSIISQTFCWHYLIELDDVILKAKVKASLGVIVEIKMSSC